MPRCRTRNSRVLRTGRHDCYDRMVIDVEGPGGGYTINYVQGWTDIGFVDTV